MARVMNMEALRAGDKFFALFDSDEALWHMRLVMRPTRNGYVVCTPDGHVYEETPDEYLEAVPCGPRGGAPSQLLRAAKYSFTARDLQPSSSFRRREY